MKKLVFIILLISFGCKKTTSRSTPTEISATPEVMNPSIEHQPAPSVVKPATNITWTDEFMELVNDHRTNLGLRALIHHGELADIARIHSQNMANGTVSFGHTGFTSRCEKARKVLGGGNWCAENVAHGQRSPQEAFNSWMNSSVHRANIETSRGTYTGLGFARSATGKYYWTQIFIEY